MKVAIITDQHFGARNDSTVFLNYYQKFYDEIFFPELDKRGITTVLDLGDTFDRRKYINFYTLRRAKKMFFDKLAERNIQVYALIGNHDTYFKNTNEVNSMDLMLGEYDNVTLIDSPQTIHLNYEDTSADVCMMPWICADNYDRSMEEMINTSAEICMGHFEIAGFTMHRGMKSHDGLNKDMFKKFDMVFSGHYHHRSNNGHIYYLGNPYELTWQDYNDPRGFHFFDLETRKLEFVHNTNRMFYRFEYDDSNGEIPDLNASELVNKFVKVVVVTKTDHYKFDSFLKKLYSIGCHDIKIVEDFSDYGDGELDAEINLEDTLDVLNSYVDSVETDEDKEKVKRFMKSLYTEAINMEVV